MNKDEIIECVAMVLAFIVLVLVLLWVARVVLRWSTEEVMRTVDKYYERRAVPKEAGTYGLLTGNGYYRPACMDTTEEV